MLGMKRGQFFDLLYKHHVSPVQMSVEDLMAREIDPLLEKISRKGIGSLTRTERRILIKARDQILRREISD